MQQLNISLAGLVSGGGPIYNAENAGLAAGIGSGIGADVAIKAAGGVGALGTGAAAVLGAAALGLLASAEAGYEVGTALFEHSEAVRGTAENIIESVDKKGVVGTISDGIRDTKRLIDELENGA